MSIFQAWGVGEVCSFLKEKEVDEEIVSLFREAQIDGNQFLNLHNDDEASLKALGIKRAMDRKYLLVLVAELHAINTPVHVVPVSVSQDPSLPLDYGQCDIHKKPRGSTFCDSCKTSLLLCDDCIDTTHNGHEFTSALIIREALREKTSSLEDISKGVCERIIGECFQSLEKLKENHVSCVEEVEAVFDDFQRALDEAKERILKKINEATSEKKAQVETDLNHAREWKKEGELLIREVSDLLSSQDDMSLMTSEHVLSPRVEGLLSSQPSMESVRESGILISKKNREGLIRTIESVVSLQGMCRFIGFELIDSMSY